MTPELKKLITARYIGWSEVWGVSLAFAVTQSVEKAERIVADAIVALIASEVERASKISQSEPADQLRLPPSVSAVRFAAVLWETANGQAFRGFGADMFFRMPAVARAIVILKVKAQLSRQQIAAALHLKVKQVDDHLENSRLLFSDGRPWIETSPVMPMQSGPWISECSQWRALSESNSNSDIFAQYVGNDLDTETGNKLHSHLVDCSNCRTSFAHFKKQYVDWAQSIPTVESDPELRKHLQKITSMALKMKRRAAPSLWPGVKRLVNDAQIRAFLLGGLSLLFLHIILTRGR